MELTDFQTINKKTKIPFRPVLICSKDEEGKFNLITVEWFMRTSLSPVMYAISIAHERYTYECLQKNRLFNIIFPNDKMGKLLQYCGIKSGRNCDKFEEMEVQYFPGRNHLPILKEAIANIELEITSQVRSGDHTIFIGEAKYFWHDPLKSNMILYPEV